MSSVAKNIQYSFIEMETNFIRSDQTKVSWTFSTEFQLEFVQRMFEWNMFESFRNCLLKSDKDGASEANLEIANI